MYLEKNYLQNLINENESDMDIEKLDQLAYLATEYENCGVINFDSFLRDQLLEILSDNEIINYYYDYLSDNYYDSCFYDIDQLIDLLSNCNCEDLLRYGYYAHDLFESNYYRFNGYGNIEGVSEYELLEDAKNDNDFLDYIINDNNIDSDIKEMIENKDIIIQASLKLVEMGY